MQQPLVLMSLLYLPVVIAAGWQCTPMELSETGWLERARLTLFVPEVDCTCNVGGRVIDNFAVSTCLVPLIVSMSADLEVPWGPHCAVRLQMLARLRSVQRRRLIVPRPFPIDEFIASGGGAVDSLQWARSLEWAVSRIERGSAVGVPGLHPQQFIPPTSEPPSSSGGTHEARDDT